MPTASITALFNMDATGVKNELANVRSEVNKTTERLGKIGLAAASAAFVKFGADALKAGAALDATADKLGISAEKIQELGFAGKQYEISQETTNMALQRFSRRLAEAAQGGGELLPILKQYNIQIKDANGNTRTAENVLGDLANTIQNVNSPTERLRIAFKAFDSEGVGLVNVLKDGKKGLEEWGDQARASGQVLENSTVAALAKASNEIENFRQRITVAVGNIIVNFRTEEGLKALGYGLLEQAARFGGKIADFIYEGGALIGAVMGGALQGIVQKFRNVFIDVVSGIAMKINEVLPSRFEINVGNLQDLKSAEQSIGHTIHAAIAQTKPTAFSDTFGDYWKGLKENAQAAATALTESEFTKTPAKLTAAGTYVKTETEKGAEAVAVAGKSVKNDIETGAASVASAASSLRTAILGIRGGDQFNNASDAALAEIARRNRSQAQQITSGTSRNLGNDMEAARLIAEAQNAERELAFRRDFQRSFARGGEAAVFRDFQNIDPIVLEKLLDQFGRNLSESQRTANALETISRGLQRNRIIPGT